MKKICFFTSLLVLGGCGQPWIRCDSPIYEEGYEQKGGDIVIYRTDACGYNSKHGGTMQNAHLTPDEIDNYCMDADGKYISAIDCFKNVVNVHKEEKQKAEAEKRNGKLRNSLSEIDAEARKDRSVLNAIAIYRKLYLEPNVHTTQFEVSKIPITDTWESFRCFHSKSQRYDTRGEDKYFIDGGIITGDDFEQFNEVLKIFSNSDLNYKCFISTDMDGRVYREQSDECILMRRNTPKSSVCFYNYKRYLPANTKIKTDSEFLRMVEAYYYFIEQPKINLHCDKLREITQAEREQCFEMEKYQQEEEEKKQIKYLEQLSTKSVPSCKKTHPEEYNEFVKRYGYNSERLVLVFEYDYKCDMSGLIKNR